MTSTSLKYIIYKIYYIYVIQWTFIGNPKWHIWYIWEPVMKGVPWLHEPRSAFNVGDWPLLKQTQQAAVSLSLYPPETIYMYSPKGTFISFLSVWSLPKGLFVHIAISSCITYYSDRQVDGQFLRCRGGRP